MVKLFSHEIGTASANPMLLMKSVVIYVIDAGVRTIQDPRYQLELSHRMTQYHRFQCPRPYTSGPLKNTNMVPLVRISELLSP